MRIEALRGRLARVAQEMPTPTRLPAGFVDPITAHLRAHIAAGETPTPTTPEARAEAEVRLCEWFARAKVRA